MPEYIQLGRALTELTSVGPEGAGGTINGWQSDVVANDPKVLMEPKGILDFMNEWNRKVAASTQLPSVSLVRVDTDPAADPVPASGPITFDYRAYFVSALTSREPDFSGD